ncbi:MAG TPA: ATP-binding protein [bacterium]|jgi:anti-sigma regulatory factor (Ser/Thr protein kinase)|nr:ATP-binding protein [bacterium]MDX9804561.1 ATP-binding protein [bacterium]HNW15416.1 ATP-binding protein [bacterium]HNZ52881.1 ATP-binding protein [bacterium]HOG43790.1 ATP-binding protein [bacterium]
MKEPQPALELNFEIRSDLNLIPGVVKKIIESSSGMFDDLYMLEVAIYEAVYNAIEHGNLEITRSRKEKMIEEGTYDDFLKGRASKENCVSKKVEIKLICCKENLKIEIKDEGKGFNWKEEMTNAKIFDGKDLNQFNGYGLRIILSVFDEVFYNESGNHLTMIKFRKNMEERIEKNTDC